MTMETGETLVTQTYKYMDNVHTHLICVDHNKF